MEARLGSPVFGGGGGGGGGAAAAWNRLAQPWVVDRKHILGHPYSAAAAVATTAWDRLAHSWVVVVDLDHTFACTMMRYFRYSQSADSFQRVCCFRAQFEFEKKILNKLVGKIRASFSVPGYRNHVNFISKNVPSIYFLNPRTRNETN